MGLGDEDLDPDAVVGVAGFEQYVQAAARGPFEVTSEVIRRMTAR